ncbi:MAG TPA: glycoside hydrolase N-terminal domain-containing protein [Puia sp.]|nr:glycoside hydrolase N-terminal domain-containing protein [Puia sp.]
MFENENERGLSSDIYDNLWEGDPVPQLPRVKNPSEQIKRWQQGEGTNYLSEEINALTKGKYPNPVRIFEAEPYPIGNGRIAASVFNGSGRDRYSLNEVSFWSGGRNGGTINNKGDKPYDIKGPDIDSAGFGSYQPIADLIVDFNAPVQKNSFIREICMDEGIVHSSGKRNNITVQSTSFCSYPDQVMVLHYQADKKGGLNATFLFATQRKIDSVVNDANSMTLNCKLANGMWCEAKAVIVNYGGTLNNKSDHIILRNADSCTILIAIETNYVMDYSKHFIGKNPQTIIEERLQKIKDLPYSVLWQHHLNDYQSLYNRLQFQLGKSADSLNRMPTPERLEAYRKNPNDPGLEEALFNFGRYLMISTSRPGSLPAGLQGIWNGAIEAPWGNDYHSNINFQMVYWLPEPGNLSECHLPMIDYLDSMREPNRLATQEYLNAIGQSNNSQTSGWVVYTSHNPFGGNGWQVNLPGSAWYGLNMWEHFAFTNDTNYLRYEAYPMMKELSTYWEAHLKTLGRGAKGFESEYKPVDVSLYPELSKVKEGTLVVPNGWSPENGPRGEDGVSHDQEIISELFLNTIKAAHVLDVDKAWAEQLKEKQARLYFPQIGKKGNLMEWMIDRDPVTDHRHTSHLFAVFPGSTISFEKTPALAEAAKKSLLFRKTTGDSRRSWAWTWRCMLWARLRNGNKAHEMIEGLIKYNMLDNFFTTHHIPLQIDGNYGIAAAMLEMLVQSQDSVIGLLPARSNKWPEGKVKGIKARGNIEVDMEWRNGKVTSWQLYSNSPKPVKVLVNGKYINTLPQPFAER